MSAASIEAVGFAVVLGVIALAALVSLFARRPRARRDGVEGDDRR